jgi:ADP-ribosylglycohydrolase
MMIQAAHDQGRITHKDTRCSAGAVAISGAVALVLQDKTIDPDAFIATLAGWTGTIDQGFADEMRNLTQWISLPPDKAADLIARAGADRAYTEDDEWKGISGFVISSVLWSLYAFLRSPDNYWETICTAIEPGGDVDTTAAMAGAISGAYLGISAIPSPLANCLNDRGTWRLEELVALAHQCYEIKMQHKT